MNQPKTAHDALQLYCDVLASRNYSQQTINSYQKNVQLFLRFLERERSVTNLRALTEHDIDAYQRYLYDYVSEKTGKKLGILTQVGYLSAVCCFLRTLVDQGVLLLNVAAEIKLPRAPVHLPRRLLSHKQVQKLLAVPDTKSVYGYRDRTMLEVLYAAGPRTSELCHLRVDDVDLDHAMLRIRNGKGLKDRTVPLTTVACNYLHEYLGAVRPLLVKSHSDSTLFLSRSGRPFDGPSIHVKLRTLAYRAKLPVRSVTARALRSAMATEMLRGHAGIRHIQEMLGHRHLAATQRYTHVVPNDLKRVHRQTHPREQRDSGTIRYTGGRRYE